MLLEDAIKAELPFVSNAMIVGDARKYLTVLVTMKTGVDEQTAEPTAALTSAAKRALAESGAPGLATVADVTASAAARSAIERGIVRANKRAISRAQHVQKFDILPEDFSIGNTMLTPTQKLKRSVVLKRYRKIVDRLYASSRL